MKLLLALGAPLLWFAQFSLTYGIASVCGPPSGLIDVEEFFSIIVGLGLTALSTVALAWVDLPLLLVSTCDGN